MPELPWTQPAWLAQAQAWIDAQLLSLGIQAMGAMEQTHIRLWSTVLRLTTTEGILYFKANAPVFAHEAPLMERLARWCPQRTVSLLAAESERGWMLMRSGGFTLRQVLESDPDSRHWNRALSVMAALQREVAPHAAELLASGVPDRRLANLPAQYRSLLTDTELLGIGRGNGLSAEEYERLQALTTSVDGLCEKLAAFGIAETIQHDDLHDGNILVQEGVYRIFDWGDSCITHPFLTLLVALRSATHNLSPPQKEVVFEQLRDTYLTAWSPTFSLADRRATFDLAYRLGMVCRALTWHRWVSTLEGAQREEYRGSVSGWLQEFLETQAVTQNR